jgi:uncharacterized protein YrzB (UPF0473 family)
MKKFLLICLLALNLGVISAQAHRYYCEVTGKQKELGGTKIIFDFGTSLTHNFWGDLSNRLKFVDENGNEIEFKSMMDAMNYMSDRGWTLLQAFATYSESSEIQHWILYKDADTQEKAKEGIMTKEEWKQKNQK